MAAQPDHIREKLKKLSCPFGCWVGEKDSFFKISKVKEYFAGIPGSKVIFLYTIPIPHS